MLVEGLQVMLVGVGAVFAFLGLLVATLFALGAAVSTWERGRPGPPSDEAEDELAVVAAAVAAAVAKRGKEQR